MKFLLSGDDNIPLSGFARNIGVHARISKIVFTFAFIGLFGVNVNPLVAQYMVIPQLVSEAPESQADFYSLRDRIELLWFARALYSESKSENEQRLVAWVIRNRVEASRYPDTYKEVVQQRNQFSGLQPRDGQYELNISRTSASTGAGWESAMSIAEEVYYSDGVVRPIGTDVMHFYSPSVIATPEWAYGKTPVHTVGARFAFYAGVK